MKIEKLRLHCTYGYFGIPESAAGALYKNGRVQKNAGGGEEQG